MMVGFGDNNRNQELRPIGRGFLNLSKSNLEMV